jgi:anti-anti-sigma factor
MSNMKESFKDLARSPEDVCLDLSQVRFLDSAGVSALVSLFKTLRSRSLKMGIIHVEGQPLHVLRQLLLGAYASPEWIGRLS